MAIARVIIEQDRDSGLPEDVVQNVLHYDGGSTPVSLSVVDAEALALDVHGAFDSAPLSWASSLAPTGRVKVYDMNAASPRVPLATREMTGIARAGDSLPNEVAIVATHFAVPVSGQVQARRRGRIYFGPLSTTNLGVINNSDVAPSATAISQVIALVQALAGPHTAGSSTFELAVYSPTSDLEGASVFEATTVSTDGWVDNAFDTQRRRGGAPSTRTTYVL